MNGFKTYSSVIVDDSCYFSIFYIPRVVIIMITVEMKEKVENQYFSWIRTIN